MALYDPKKRKKKDEEEIGPVRALLEAIGPVRDDVKPQREYIGYGPVREDIGRTYLQKGALDGGATAENVGKAILGTLADAGEDFTTGFLGAPEKILKGLVNIGTMAMESQVMTDPVAQLAPVLKENSEDVLRQTKEAADAFAVTDLYDEKALAQQIIAGVPGAIANAMKTQQGQQLTQEDMAEYFRRAGENLPYVQYEMEGDSVLGEKSDSIAQSIGSQMFTRMLGTFKVPWQVTTGLDVYGSELENALGQGADRNEAMLSAAVSAGGEILSEYITGGMFGETGLDEKMVQDLSRTISNKLVRNVAAVTIKAGGEGLEEAVSWAVGKLGQKLSYLSETEWKELYGSEEAWEELLESVISGGITGGLMNTTDAVVKESQGIDYASEMTANEQKVVQQEYQNRVAEAEKKGKLSEKEKKNIYKDVLDAMEKGGISIDTIEETLGGETYQQYKQVADWETGLQKQLDDARKEYDALQEMKRGEMTGKQQSREAELGETIKKLETQIKNVTATSSRDQLKAQLGQEVQKLTEGDRLSESYRERDRRRQTFKADLTKYDAKQRSVIQKAMDSGILNNTNRTHEFVDMIARISADKGVPFDFTSNEKLKESGFAVQEGVTRNGMVTKDGISININSAKALNSVVGHEITHVLEGTELYAPMQKLLFDYAKTKGEYDSRLKAITELYREHDPDADPLQELTADLVGDYLFSDTDFIRKLNTEDRDLFQKLWDEVKYLCKVVTAGSKEAKQLEQVKKAFEEAYRESGAQKNTAQEGGVKYSLMEFKQDGRRYVEIDQDQDRFEGHTLDEYPGIAKDIIKEKFENKVVGIDNKMFVNGAGRSEYAYPSKPITDDEIYAAKMRAAPELDNLLDAGTNYRNEADGRDGHIHPDAVDGFDYYDILFKIGERFFEGRINIKNIKRGKLFKDITQIKDVTQAIMSSYGKNPKSQFLRTSSMSIISKPDSIVKNSLSDSSKDIGPVRGDIYGSDVAVERTGEIGPVMGNATPNTSNAIPNANNATANASLPDDTPIRDDIEQRSDDDMDAEEPPEIKTVKERLTEKLYSSREELASNEEHRMSARKHYAKEIKKAETEYDRKKNKNTKTAQDLLRRIDRLKRLQRDVDAQYNKRISDIKARIQKTEEALRKDYTERDRLENTLRKIDRELEADKEELKKDYETQKAKFADRNTYISQNAAELYRELMGMRKGVRASEQLSQLLEHNGSRDWSAIRAALVNIRHTPDRQVNQRSDAEAFARELLGSDYETRREQVETDYQKALAQMEEKAEERRTMARRANQRRLKDEEYTEWSAQLVGNTAAWVDKPMGWQYAVNTLRRNMRDVVRDEKGNKDIARADAITDAIQGVYNHHEAELNREANRIKQAYADLKLTDAEDVYIQMLGEFRHNPDTELTKEEVLDYLDKHRKDIDEAKVNKAIEMARETYDMLIERVNEVLREQGMKEIPYRQGYFPHFTDQKQSKIAKWLNWKTKDDSIPTDIAGLTEMFNPVRSYQSFNKERTTDTTDYRFTRGLDNYVAGALDWIYHMEDIQKRRAFENYIRYVHSDEGVQARIDEIRANPDYDADEAQRQIEMIWAEAKNPLGNFVTDFHTATNTLAGKKSSMDRGMEQATNRKIYSVMTNISNRVSADMVVGSISAALTNFIPITQSWGEVSPITSLRAMKDTIRNRIRDDGTIEKSDFLTNRLHKVDNLYKTGWDKASDLAGKLMTDWIDGFTSQTVWRSKYLENIDAGMSENEAIYNADIFAENVMAGRSRGNQPTIFDSKNPLIKVLTAFNLEVVNQYGYMFKDMPEDLKKEGTGKLVLGYTEMYIGAWVYNMLYSSLTGRDAAFDPIGIVVELIQDLLGSDDEEEDAPISQALTNLADNVLEQVPFIGGLVGGGRVPISAAIPYEGVYEMVTGTMQDIEEKDWAGLTEEWLNPVWYGVAPMFGGQLKKTIQGLGMFSDDHTVAGSYTASGKLRFPVEDTIGNRLQAAVFGQYASGNAREYFDQGRSPLTAKQTEEFAQTGMTIQQYWDYRDGLKDLKTLNEKADYICSLDLTTAQKNILINNVAGRKDPIDLTGYEKYENFEEFDFARQNPEKYEFFQKIGMTVKKWNWLDKDRKAAYNWAFANPEAYEVSRLVTDDVYEYRQYMKAMQDMTKAEATDYINNLGLSYAKSIILMKAKYPTDDTYNLDIINAVDARNSLTYAEKVAVLEELGFDVDRKGYVTW